MLRSLAQRLRRAWCHVAGCALVLHHPTERLLAAWAFYALGRAVPGVCWRCTRCGAEEPLEVRDAA